MSLPGSEHRSGTPSHRVLVCACSRPGEIPPALERGLAEIAEHRGTEVCMVGDLCGLAATSPDTLRGLLDCGRISIIACFARTVRALLEWVGAAWEPHRMISHNLRTTSVGEILGNLAWASPAREANCVPSPVRTVPKTHDGWVPWFPVVDSTRCSQCAQCLNFCLFGVYSRDERGRISVVHPEACKTNCPACARICPEVAIIFPKYDAAPINGAEITDMDAERERIRLDMLRIAGPDIQSALADRNRRRLALLKRAGEAESPAGS